MFKPLIATVFVAALLPLSARASDLDCHYELKSDIRIDGDAVELRGDDGTWRLDGDRLRHDGQDVNLNARQHAAVDEYRRGVLQLVPAVNDIALDAGMLGIEAMTMSFAALTDDPDDLRKYQKRAEKLGAKVHERYAGRTMLQGSLAGGLYDDALDAEIDAMAEQAAADMAGNITSLVFSAIFHPGRIEARADSVERLVEQRIEPKADALEARARPLCAQTAHLDSLESVIGIDAIDVDDHDHDHDHDHDDHHHHHGFSFSF
ncbi:DUF2884 family protein [Solimonas marina]|uniref:YggN family protein n=1 Tax=Solimonas marina TaxID=2714601 RepID=A0A970B7Q9_9GAMM|nr:DUF2884 family protein [Solimonas marina]NKF23945.1 YggN family protein [Solimonas marina]